MKDAVTILLCAVALAQGLNLSPNQRRPCNCDPSEAQQICQANYGYDDVLIAHENCDQFYKCANGKPVAYFCPNSLLYDPVAETCEWPESVDCGNRPISDGPIKEEDDGSDNVSDVDNDGTCNCNPGEAPTICAAEGSNGILVAHQNCNQFYKCAEGRPVTFDCSPTLLYNPYKGECDWAHNVECGDRVIPEPKEDDSSDDDVSTENDITCNCNPEEAPAICAAPGSESELIAHEDCNKYYICNHGVPVVVSCFGDLLFNPYTRQCDWPRNVDCGDRLVPETECTGCNDNASNDNDTICDDDDSVSAPGLTNPGVTNPAVTNPGVTNPADHTPGNNCDPSEAPSICAADDSEGVLVAHENCDQFYKCSGGKPVALLCPPNLLFNPAKDECDWPEDVDCGDRVIPDPESSDSDSEEIRPPGDDVVVAPTRPPGTCNCNPGEAPSICGAEDSDGVLVAHENCNQFYMCDHGKPVVMSCSGALLYNPYTEKCDWPENVDCGDRVIPDPDDSVTTPGGTNPGVTNPADTTPGNNCDPSEAPAICAADDSEGVLVAHENCDQFYMCSGGKPVAMTCPPKLLFNPNKDQCDWPENVDCGDRVIPDPESSDSDSEEIRPPGDDVVVAPTRPPSTCNCNPGEAPSICGAEDSDGVLVAHENCNQFYMCDHGKPVVMSCSGALLYNPHTEQCDWPENVDCGDRVIPDPDDSVTTPGGTNPGVTNPADTTPGNNCDPSEAPAICAADDSEGVLVAHENCDQFYMCSGGKPVAMTCPPKLLFNPNKNQCDWPENVDCGDRVIPDPESSDSDSEEIRPPGDDVVVAPTRPPGTCNCNPGEAPSICGAEDSDGVLVAHENCNQFYMCDHGKPVVMSCSGALLYNPYTEQCDWPENVKCGDRVIPDPDDSVTIPGGTNPGVTNPADTTPGNNCDPSEAPAICAADDSEGVLVAHENCDQFYMCSGGKPVAMTCPPKLLFNPNKDQCDWPENVDCGDRVIPDPESSDSDSEEIRPPGDDVVVAPTRPPGTCNCNPGEAPSICGAEDSDGVLVAHENCNQFYMCDHGKPVVMSCSGALLYNPYTEQCDWPENVECGDRVIPDPDDSVTIPGGTNPGVTNPADTTPGNNCDPSEAPAICAADDSEGVLVAHENCDQFYMCSGGKPVAMTCPPKLLFNPNKDQCDWPENVDCGDRVIPDPESSDSDSEEIRPPGDDVVVAPTRPPGTCNCNPGEAPSICGAEDSDGVLVAHENCNQFYMCDHGKPVVMSCSGALLYNPYTEQCDWPENVECGDRVIPDPDDSVTIPGGTNPGVTNPADTTPGNNCDPSEAPAICAADDSEGVLVAHENCDQFYMCSGGKPVAMTCPPKLLFNPNKDQCDWPENVDCGDRVIPDPESSDSDSEEIRPPGDDVVVAPTRPPGTCNCNPGEAPSICGAEDSDGVLVAHENCNQFYMCDHGKPVVMSCSGALLYNPYTEQCDWPENVKCGDRVIPDPDDSVTIPGGTNPGVTNPADTTPGNNCDPSEAPAICAADDSEGVLVAHENCDQFYMCSGGKPVAMTCPPKLLFNPNKDQCDWPENVDCGDRVIPDPESSDSDSEEIRPPGDDVVVAPTRPPGTCNCNPGEAPSICGAEDSDGVLVAHENCNQFYICDHGKPVVMSCSGALLYNPYTEQCDWPENVECGDRVIPDPDDSVTIPGGTNPGVTNPADTTPGNNCDPSEAPAICAADDSEGVLVAHENCDQFYMCSGGKPVAMTCPPKLLFNPNKDQCDWPENVDCGDRVIPDPESSDSDSEEIRPPGDDVVVAPTRPPGTCNCNPGEAPSICGAEDSDGVLVAHENCNQFYMCDHGKPVVMSCSGALLYNPHTEQCDWPENVDCGDRVIPDPDDSVTTPGGTNPGVTNPADTTPGNNCDPSEAPAICAADDSEGVLVAHENCDQFYMCSGGKPVAMTCPPKLLFNPNKDQCDWPENVDCVDRVIPDPESSDSDSEEIRPPGDDVPPQPPITDSNEDCSGTSNDNGGTCNCDPDEAPSICAVGNSNGILIAHENCNQFYKCDNGRPIPLKCPTNTFYNPVTQGCDWENNVECGDRFIPDPEENESESNEDDSKDEEHIVGPCNCNPEEAPAICAAEGSSGILIAHENCNQFYMCDYGGPVAFTCNGFLLYNPYTERCDWPESVECGDRVIPEPGTESNENDSTEENISNPHDDPSQAPTICAGTGSDGVLVAHENCDKYYICSGGVPISRPCNDGLLFNPLNEHCDWPNNVVCGDRIRPDDCACNPRNAPALCARPKSEGKLVAHENCNQFYICANSVPVAQTCPASLLYNPDTEFCDWPQKVKCENRLLSSATLNKHRRQSRQTLKN